jgi:hypothetical protein
VTRWRTLLAVHAVLSLAALALAAPFATLGGAVMAGRPDGDLAFWAGGGELAADGFIRLAPFAGAALRLAAAVLCLWALVAPLTTALLLDAHHQGADPGLSRLPAAARTLWGPFLAQRAALVVALVLAGTTGAACVHLAGTASEDWPDAAAQGLLSLAALLPALALAALAGAATDLAHAMTTRGAPRPLATWLAAARWALLHPIRTAGPYALTVAAAALSTLVAAMLAERLGGSPGLPALALFAVQQAVAFGRTALRSAWLETTLGLAAQHR